jgi:hypothetical protein
MLRARSPLKEPLFSPDGSGAATLTNIFSQQLEDVLAPDGGRTQIGADEFSRLSSLVEIDPLMVDPRTDDDDVLSVQVKFAAISVVRSLSRAIFQNDLGQSDSGSVTKSLFGHRGNGFRGLPSYISGTAQDIPFGQFDGLIHGLTALEVKCQPSDGDFGGRLDAFVMSSRTRSRLLGELEDRNLTPHFVNCPFTGRLQLHFHGIPVLTGRVREGRDGTSDAWALKLLGPSAVRVCHVGGDSSGFGVQVGPRTNIVQNEASGSIDLSNTVEIFGTYSLVVPELQSVSRLTAIPDQ